MKAILIVQTIIILAAAVYIYLTAYREPTVPISEPVTSPSVTTDNGTSSAVVTYSTTVSETTATATIPAGPNDAGMEWPTLEAQ